MWDDIQLPIIVLLLQKKKKIVKICFMKGYMVCVACSSSLSRGKALPLSINVLMRKGRPRPRLMSNTLEPMALDTAMSPNPSLATRMELIASCKGDI